MEMRKTRFGIDCWDEEFIGYTNGEHWNGWACPRFTKDVADKIVELQNKGDGCKATYDEEVDAYLFKISTNSLIVFILLSPMARI